jgi:homoserine trans-succinylase
MFLFVADEHSTEEKVSNTDRCLSVQCRDQAHQEQIHMGRYFDNRSLHPHRRYHHGNKKMESQHHGFTSLLILKQAPNARPVLFSACDWTELWLCAHWDCYASWFEGMRDLALRAMAGLHAFSALQSSSHQTGQLHWTAVCEAAALLPCKRLQTKLGCMHCGPLLASAMQTCTAMPLLMVSPLSCCN